MRGSSSSYKSKVATLLVSALSNRGAPLLVLVGFALGICATYLAARAGLMSSVCGGAGMGRGGTQRACPPPDPCPALGELKLTLPGGGGDEGGKGIRRRGLRRGSSTSFDCPPAPACDANPVCDPCPVCPAAAHLAVPLTPSRTRTRPKKVAAAAPCTCPVAPSSCPSAAPALAPPAGADAGFSSVLDAVHFPPGRVNTSHSPLLLPWVAEGVEYLRHHQHDKFDCASPATRFLVVGEGMEIHPNEGMGANAHMLARRLALAVSMGRVLVFADHMWPYGGPAEASVGRWQAGFQPIGSCTPEDAGVDTGGMGAGGFTRDSPGPRSMLGADKPFPDGTEGWYSVVPDRFAAYGWKGWWTILLTYILRPSEGMLLQTADYFAGLSNMSAFSNRELLADPAVRAAGIIGMHIRLGERPAELKRGWDLYVGVARNVAARTGARALLVASDDAGVRQRAGELTDFAVFVVPTRVVRRPEDASRGQSIVLHEGPADQRSGGTSDALAVVLGLASSNYVISTCMSQLSRTGSALQLGFGRQRGAPLAVDDASCYCEHKHFAPVVEGYVPAGGTYVPSRNTPLSAEETGWSAIGGSNGSVVGRLYSSGAPLPMMQSSAPAKLSAPVTSANSGVSGKAWRPSSVRTWTGGLKFTGSLSAEAAPSAPPVDPTDGCVSDRWIVITTIFAPSELVGQAAGLDDWCTVVVADKKTPLKKWKGVAESEEAGGRVHLLTVAEQEALPFRSAALLPWNHFGRKNLGYLYAIARGARLIYDTDDDNLLKPGGWSGTASPPTVSAPTIPVPGKDLTLADVVVAEACGGGDGTEVALRAWNPYPLFGGGGSESWPRGFPLNDITSTLGTCRPATSGGGGGGGRRNLGVHAVGATGERTGDVRIGVWQSLVDLHPDIDAIHRLTRLPLTYDFARIGDAEVVSADSGVPPQSFVSAVGPARSWAPFNAQATLYEHTAFWGLLLPVTVHGRVSDIWRSYIVQRLFEEPEAGGLTVAFVRPWADQHRTAHDFLNDFVAEEPLYERAGALVDLLRAWEPRRDAHTLPAIIEQLYVTLYENGVLESTDVEVVQAWLQDLSDAGYKFGYGRTADAAQARR
jgi:hypothetical protein